MTGAYFRISRGLAVAVLAGLLATPTPAAAAGAAGASAGVEAALEQAGAGAGGIDSWMALSISSTQEGWKATGLRVEAGQAVTIFGFGGIPAAEGIPPGLERFEPRHLVWARVGEDGDILNLAANQYSFAAARSGELFVAVPPPGTYWAAPDGTFPDYVAAMPPLPLDMRIVAVAWAGDAQEGLARLAQEDGDAFGRALADARRGDILPDGFSYLWYLGQSRVFERFAAEGRRGVRGRVADDYGIIKKAVDLPLDGDTAISFDWRYDALPAEGPETEARFHDYLSIAVEFDNGQDITWLWSPELEAGQMFRCPLFWWDQRETHIVLQSGSEGLGRWHSYRRGVLADYMAAVGGAAPRRIVGVWIIGVSMAGHTPGEAAFADVVLRGNGKTIEIFGNSN